jgi:hypothetical protein
MEQTLSSGLRKSSSSLPYQETQPRPLVCRLWNSRVVEDGEAIFSQSLGADNSVRLERLLAPNQPGDVIRSHGQGAIKLRNRSFFRGIRRISQRQNRTFPLRITWTPSRVTTTQVFRGFGMRESSRLIHGPRYSLSSNTEAMPVPLLT